MPTPNSQSLKPPVTLSSVKSILTPIFDNLYATAPESAGSQRMDNADYMQVHTACFDYFTGSQSPVEPRSSSAIVTKKGVGIGGRRVPGNAVWSRSLTEDETIDQIIKRGSPVGYEFYRFIDEYFRQKAGEKASELALGDDKAQAVKEVLRQFSHYNAISRIVARMLGYFDRYYIKRVTLEGAGWLRKSDLDAGVVPKGDAPPKEQSFSELLAYKQKEHEHLVNWGYTEGEGGRISRDDALASAPAASSSDRIIPMHPLAMRWFRMKVVEPLILNSDELVQWIKQILLSASQEDLDGEFKTMAMEFQEMLRRVGVLEQHFFL